MSHLEMYWQYDNQVWNQKIALGIIDVIIQVQKNLI